MILQLVTSWWIIAIIFTPLCLGASVLIWKNRRTPSQRRAWIRRLVLVLLLLVVALRPVTPGGSRAAGNGLLDVYFVIDTTVSATAEDYNGNRPRIEGMRHDVKQIAKDLVGARFSIITFDNHALQALPLTHDTTTLASAVDTISIQDEFYAVGSSIDTGLDTLHKELERIAKKAPNRGRVVFYMGDGEQTADTQPKSFSSIKQLIKGGAVMGYGTESGGKMADEVRRQFSPDKNAYIKDHSIKDYSTPTPDAVSKIDQKNLQAIASQAGLKYFHRTAPNDTKEITNGIDIGEIIQQSSETDAYNDWYWVVVPGIVLLLYIELLQLRRIAKSLKVARKGATT